MSSNETENTSSEHNSPPSGSSRRAVDSDGSVEVGRAMTHPLRVSPPPHAFRSFAASSLNRTQFSSNSPSTLSSQPEENYDFSFGPSTEPSSPVIFDSALRRRVLPTSGSIRSISPCPPEESFEFSLGLSSGPSSPVRVRLTPDQRAWYYHGLPSAPTLVASSQLDSGASLSRVDTGYPAKKHLLVPLSSHALLPLWKDLGPRLFMMLCQEVEGPLCLDVCRIGRDEGEETDAVMIIWIGVQHAAVSDYEGDFIVNQIKQILIDEGVTDVEVEMRETTIERSSRLYDIPIPDESTHPKGPNTPKYDGPFSNALGLPISAAALPGKQGTSAICLRHATQPERHFLLTAHHCVAPLRQTLLPPAPHGCRVSLFTTHSYTRHMRDLSEDIAALHFLAQPNSPHRNTVDHNDLAKLQLLEPFIHATWDDPDARSLGRVYAFPPFGLGGASQFSSDWALIEVDKPSGNWARHNRLDLRLNADILLAMKQRPADLSPSLGAVPDGMLEIRGFLDRRSLASGDVAVLKRGSTTHLTLGRTSPYESFTRTNDGDIETESMELPIYSVEKNGRFSDVGDSGAAIVTRSGELCAIVTGGPGPGAQKDITYSTPFFWIKEEMEKYDIHMSMI